MEPYSIDIQGDKPVSQLIEDAKKVIQNAGYQVGEFKTTDLYSWWCHNRVPGSHVTGDMQIDPAFAELVAVQGYFEEELDGTKVYADVHGLGLV